MFYRKAVFILALVATTTSAVTSVAIAAGDPAAGEKKAVMAGCATAACHGMKGVSIVPGTPHLAALGEKYLTNQIRSFRKNPSPRPGVMTALILTLPEEDIADVVAFFTSQKRTVKPVTPDDEKVALGESIYRGGIPHVNISACMGCHGPTGTGLLGSGYPSVAGQDATYTLNQLKAFQSESRHNDANKEMRSNVKRMTEKEMQAVALYMQSLKPITSSTLSAK